MRSEGYEIKRGKYLEFRGPGQLRFTRSFRLGEDYTLDALRERCGKLRVDSGEVRTPAQAKAATTAPAKKAAFRPLRNVNLLIDFRRGWRRAKVPMSFS